VAGAWVIGVVAWGATGCAGPSSYFHPAKREQADGRQLVQVMVVGSRSDIVGLGKDYELLLASGIPDSALTDGRIAIGRIYCCGGLGGTVESSNQLRFFVPADLSVEVGDVVELRLGREPGGAGGGTVNEAVRVRARAGAPDHPCRWVPPNDRLWMRVLYCDSLEAEGWTHKNGIGNPWLRLPTADLVRR